MGTTPFRYFRLSAIFLLLLSPLRPVEAASVPLIVGVKEAPPFATKDDRGSWEGISIELWNRIAEMNGFSCEFREMEFEELLDAVAREEVDAGVSAITVTSAREEAFDFTQPFFLSGLGIAVREKSGDWWSIIRGFFSFEFLRIVSVLALVLLVSGFLVWLFERRRNPDQFGGPASSGVGSGFWWAAVTMTTVGYGDKAPKTAGGRLVALVWMFASLVIISGFTAAITTSLTVGSLDGAVKGPGDLHSVRTATVSGSTSQHYLEEEYIAYREFDTLPEALRALREGRVDAVVYDEPIMRYAVSTGKVAGVTVLEQSFRYEYYAIALPPGSRLRESVNRSLLQFTASREWRSILFRYLNYAL